MFKSANVVVAWSHRLLKHYKQYILKLLNNMHRNGFFAIQAVGFLLFTDKKIWNPLEF